MGIYKGFVVNSHYELVENKALIHLYGRLENGKSFEVVVQNKPYFFIKASDELNAKQIIRLNIESTKLQTLNHEAVVKIIVQNPKQVPELRKLLEDNNIACFEADIRFTQRYFIDKNILSCIEIEGTEKKGTGTDLFFEQATIRSTNTCTSKPSMLSIDIETKEDMSVYSVALYNEEIQELIVVENKAMNNLNKQDLKQTSLVKNEKELIVLLLKRIKEIDPDIITGWNLIDFDLQVLAKQAKKHKILFTIGRTKEVTSLRLEQSFFRDSSVYCKGREVLDGIQLLKSSFVKLENFKLNTAAQHYLKEGKALEADEDYTAIARNYEKQAKKFLEYNLKDAQLVYNILMVSGVYDLTLQRSLLTGLHMGNVKASIASFDSIYLRELRKAGYVAASTRPQERDQGLGGFVMNSKPGIYNNILVLDFKSLYPSLMRTFNIDPVAFQGMKDELKEDVRDSKKFIIAPNGAVFANNKGILPELLHKLWDARENARKEKNELARFAIKTLMNSMYGVLASPNSRFHNRSISNAITYFGQHFIKLTAELIEKKGYDVIYGDTDSVFVNPKTEDTIKAQKIGKKLEQELNLFLKKDIAKKYSRESILELEFEKLFVKFFMPSVRGSDVGAKKRYAGLKLITGEQTKESQETKLKTVFDFTGLEFVRRDWTKLAKEFQLTLLDLVFKDEDVSEFVKKFVDDLKKGKYDKLLVYKKSLRKDVNAYTKTTPPHVKAARLLDKITSTNIEYVITTEGPQPIEKQTAALDYNHYIDKQIKPIANSVLELKGTNFEDVMKGSTQTGLGSFM